MIQSNDVIPTACAEYSGSMLYNSASIDTLVAHGIAHTAVRNRDNSVDKQSALVSRHIRTGIIINFITVT